MKDGELYFISKTPITEKTFERQGWEKIVEKDDDFDDGDVYTYYILPLPKDNPDPSAPFLISSADDEYKEIGLNEGEYIVELGDYMGLGLCNCEEELDLLYKLLTKKTIE